MYFSVRAQLYNHNTVLVLGVALTLWCALRAARGHPAWWLATGTAAAAAVLSKYQALLPLSGVLAGLVLTQRAATRAQRQGLAAAIVTALVLLSPNLLWLIRHDFSSFDYASEAVQRGGAWHRLGFVGSFAANQLRTSFPMLAALGLSVLLTRRSRAGAPAGTPATDTALAVAPPDVDRDARVWFWCLLGWPLAVVVALGLIGSVSLRNHWGVQTMQFFGLWLAWMWQPRVNIVLARLAAAAVVVHAASLTLYAAQQLAGLPTVSARRIDTMYPAQRLADAALRQWRSVTTCPLRYVAGDAFTGGLVSVYSGQFPAVFKSAHASPWISADDLRRHGALHVLADDAPVPPGAVAVFEFDLGTRRSERLLRGRAVTLAAVPPAQPCP